MSGNAGGFEDDPLVVPGSYSQLLLGDEISGLQTDGCSGFTSSFPPDDNIIISSPKMLCFGDYAKQCNMKVAVESAKKTGQKFGPACEDSSLPVSNKKRNGSGTNERTGFQSGTPVESLRNSKKPKPDNSTVSGHAKVVKREKLGDRITALQQLVSPFGKTDTTSVLHEALGYIKFLHEQVQVLCSPYLQFSEDLHHPDKVNSKTRERIKNHDLRSRGLCLVPMELTLQVVDSNGADLWSPAVMVDNVPTS